MPLSRRDFAQSSSIRTLNYYTLFSYWLNPPCIISVQHWHRQWYRGSKLYSTQLGVQGFHPCGSTPLGSPSFITVKQRHWHWLRKSKLYSAEDSTQFGVQEFNPLMLLVLISTLLYFYWFNACIGILLMNYYVFIVSPFWYERKFVVFTFEFLRCFMNL